MGGVGVKRRSTSRKQKASPGDPSVTVRVIAQKEREGSTGEILREKGKG